MSNEGTLDVEGTAVAHFTFAQKRKGDLGKSSGPAVVPLKVLGYNLHRHTKVTKQDGAEKLRCMGSGPQ